MLYARGGCHPRKGGEQECNAQSMAGKLNMSPGLEEEEVRMGKEHTK